jgi:hypothetical protein
LFKRVPIRPNCRSAFGTAASTSAVTRTRLP